MKPQLATEVPIKTCVRYMEDGGWAIEQKLDGHRILLSDPDGNGVVAIGRDGRRYGHDLPKPLRKLRIPEGWQIDAELINGTAWAFDTIPPGRADLPLHERRLLLAPLVQILKSPSVQIVPQAVEGSEKAALVRRAIDKNHEGLVIKDLDSPYLGGRQKSWLKIKFVSTIDVVVVDLRDDGKESMTLGVYDGDSTMEIGHCSILGKPEVTVGDVVEIRYLYAVNRDRPRLVQPRMMKTRTDKAPIECTSDQLKFTNKTVMTEAQLS